MTPTADSTTPTTYVLAHGAFHGSWCWGPVVDALASRGHRVVAPDLHETADEGTSVGDLSLDAAVSRVVETIDAQDDPVVLVGHSMGGVVITQVADRFPDSIERLVYVSGFRPRDGESLLDLSGRPEGTGDQVQANLTIEGDPPVATFDTTKARDVFYHDCPEDLARWATERLTPESVAIYGTPVSLRRGAFSPVDYVVCTEDQAAPLPLQRLMAERDAARVVELESSHSPFLSRTEELVDILTTETRP